MVTDRNIFYTIMQKANCGDEHFDNAHGICRDTRAGAVTLLITDRMKNKLKRFSMDGQLLEVIDLPGAYICRPVIHGEHVYTPRYENGQLQRMYQTLKIFQHPHDVCVDEDENLYVAQWNAGKSYPIKMYRIP